MVDRVAMLCLHTSPLDQPGTGSGGGMNVYVRELARALANADIAVDIFTRSTGWRPTPPNHSAVPERGIYVVEDAPGVRVVAVPAGPAGPLPKGALADLAPALIHAIDEVAEREKLTYDVVHSHYWISGLVAKHLSRRWSVPLVHMFHTLSRVKSRYAGSAEDARRALEEQRVLEAADAVIVPNATERAYLRELYTVGAARLVTIPCGIDVEPFTQQSESPLRPHQIDALEACPPCPRPVAGCLSPDSRAPEPRFVVAALGRLERLKNFDLLLRAIALACAQDIRFASQVELRIAGGPASEEPEVLPALRALAADLGIADHVSFLGPVPRAEVPTFYHEADVCVVPSRHESFGLVALEAMAAGLPVVATGVGGLQETVVDGVTGYLVSPDHPERLAQKLLLLWSSPCLRTALGLHGARAAQHYAWPQIAERVRCLYESLVTGEQAAAR